MVDVSHKPSFSSAEALKVPFCGRSAFALKPCFQPLVSSFDSAKVSAVEELVITGYDRIYNPSVDANDFFRNNFGRSVSAIGYEVKNDSPSFDAHCCGSDFPGSILLVVFGDSDRDSDSSLEGGERDATRIQKRCERIVIQSDRRVLLLDGQPLQPFPLEHVAGLISCGTDVTAVESAMLSSDLLIGGVVDFGLVISSFYESCFESDVAGCVVESDRFGDSLVITEF